jgi:hypothetical protein
MSDSDEMADSITVELGLEGRIAHISLKEFERCLTVIEALMEEMDRGNSDLIEVHHPSGEENEALAIILKSDSTTSGCSDSWIYN